MNELSFKYTNNTILVISLAFSKERQTRLPWKMELHLCFNLKHSFVWQIEITVEERFRGCRYKPKVPALAEQVYFNLPLAVLYFQLGMLENLVLRLPL